jgi:hypothetical protein
LSNKNFTSGAVRSADAEDVRFDLICPTAEERLARIYQEGAVKYGDTNYAKGIPLSNILNHGKRHLNLYLRGDRSEDHIAKVAWACFAFMHFDSLCQHHGTTEGMKIKDKVYLEAQRGPR